MRKYLTLILVVVLTVAFVVGAMSPTYAVRCKETKCWHECVAGHYYECCRYACPQGGSFIDCEYTGYMCAW